MSEILFSIVIPFKNTVSQDRSVLMDELCHTIPDRPDVEVLWMDDHSDKAVAWHPPQSHVFTRHRVIAMPEGQFAPGPARDLGVREAVGRWIVFADNDDRFDTGAFSRVLDSVLEMDVSVDVVVCGVTSFQGDGTLGSRHDFLEVAREVLRSTGSPDLLCRHMAPYGKIIRRSLFGEDRVCFDTGLYAEDVLFANLLAVFAKAPVVADEIIYAIREGHESLTSSSNPVRVAQEFRRVETVQKRLLALRRPDLIDSSLTLQLVRLHGRHHPVLVAKTLWRLWREGHVLLPSRAFLARRFPSWLSS